MPKIVAPWTDEQVDALNDYQAESMFHPYTCSEAHTGDRRNLVATTRGWICRYCNYTQDWAHSQVVEAWQR